MNNYTITNLATPTDVADAATKLYVDSVAHKIVRVATAIHADLNNAVSNNSVIDGVTLVTGDRILFKNQNNPIENGIYVVNESGAPTRLPQRVRSTQIGGLSVSPIILST